LRVKDVDVNSLESNCKRKKTEDTKFKNLDEDSLLSVSSSNITPISFTEEVEKNIPVLLVEDSTFSVINSCSENSNIIDNVRL